MKKRKINLSSTELLVIITVISLVIAVAVPGFMRVRELNWANRNSGESIKTEFSFDSHQVVPDWQELVNQYLYLKKTPHHGFSPDSKITKEEIAPIEKWYP